MAQKFAFVEVYFEIENNILWEFQILARRLIDISVEVLNSDFSKINFNRLSCHEMCYIGNGRSQSLIRKSIRVPYHLTSVSHAEIMPKYACYFSVNFVSVG